MSVKDDHEDKPRTVPPITSDRLAAIACHTAESDDSTREIRVGYLADLLGRVPDAQAIALMDAEL